MPSCWWSTTVVWRSSGPSGVGLSRAVYHSSLRQAVSSSSEPASSSWRATCSAPVCSSTSIWVTFRCGCSALITRSRPRRPPCSRLARSSAQHRLRRFWSGRTAGASGPDFGQLAGDAHQVLDVVAALERRLRAWSGSPVLGCGDDDHAVERTGVELVAQPAGLGRVVGLQRPGHRGASVRRALSGRRSARVAAMSAASEVLTSSHVPGSVTVFSGTSRCCHSMVSSRSPSTRSRSLPAEAPVPICRPCTANSTAPCSSRMSRSASQHPSAPRRSPSSGSTWHAGPGRRRAAAERPAAAAARHRRGRWGARPPTGSRRPASAGCTP